MRRLRLRGPLLALAILGTGPAVRGFQAPAPSADSASAPPDSLRPSAAPRSDSTAGILTDSVAIGAGPSADDRSEEPRTLTGTQAGSTVLVRGQARHKRKEVSSQTLTREDIHKVAATAQDPIRALPTLPGVTTSSDLSVRPIVRGGDLAETGVELDGIPLLMPYHFGSVFSIFHQEALEDFQLYSGVAPARAEGALSGTVLARTRPPRTDSLVGGFDISMLRSSAWIGIPLVKDKLALWLSGQTMWYDWTLKRTMDLGAVLGMVDSKSINQFEQQVTLPTSWDAQAGISYRITPGLLLDMGGFLASDKFLVRDPIDICLQDGREVPCYTSHARTESVCVTYTPVYKEVPCGKVNGHATVMDTSAWVGLWNWMGRARLGWNPDPDLSIEAVAGLQSSDWQVRFPGSRELVPDTVHGGWAVTRVDDHSKFSWDQNVSDLQLTSRRRWNREHETSAGLSWRRESEDVETDLLRPVAQLIMGNTGNPLEFMGIYNQRETVYLAGPTDLVDLDKLENLDFRYSSSSSWNRPAAWAEHRWDPDSRTRIRAGLRLSGTRDGGMEIPSPRLQAQMQVTESDMIGLGAALHGQSDLPFEWRLSASKPLVPEKAWLGIAEWEHDFGGGWRTTASGWGKWYQDLASARVVADSPMDANQYKAAAWQWAVSNMTKLGIPDSLNRTYRNDPALPDSVNQRLREAFTDREWQAIESYLPPDVLQMFQDYTTARRLSYASTGIGWAAGFEASVRYKPTQAWTGWASAEWSVSRRKDFDGGIWYPFGQERPWKLSWVNAFRVNRTWELSLRYSAVAGNPYTPFRIWNLDGTNYTAPSSTSDTTLWMGRRNSATLAPYQRLDLRIAKESTVFGLPATWYWEIWNAFNDPNFVLRDSNTGEFRWITTNIPFPVVFVGVQARF